MSLMRVPSRLGGQFPGRIKSNWSNLYLCNNFYGSFPNAGTAVTVWNAVKGRVPTPNSAIMSNSMGGVGVQNFDLSSVGASYLRIDQLGVDCSGSKSISLFFAGLLGHTATPAGTWHLWNFSKIGNATRVFRCFGTTASGAHTLNIQRVNDAAGAASAPSTLTPNSNAFTLAVLYDFPNAQITTRLNAVTVDNAAALNAGVLTLDRFEIGVCTSLGGGYGQPQVTGFAVEPNLLTIADCQPLENYFMRMHHFP